MNIMPLPVLLALLLGLLLPAAPAQESGSALWLPSLYGDGMVLQREAPLRFHGKAAPGAEVRLDLAFGELRRSGRATAGEDGVWSLALEALPASGPGTVTVASGSDSRTLTDVWIGEVWICSGQSNMEWSMRHGIQDTAGFRAGADQPDLRLFQVPKASTAEPQEDCRASWSACTPETVFGFSAVAYFFGRELLPQVDCKIGLIESAWGGSAAEAWTAPEDLAADPDLAPLLENVEKAPPNHKASHLMNGMLAPLFGFGIRGVIWYQGESNAGRAWQYRKLFPTMIRSWRRKFDQGDFPFLWVQLASFKAWKPEPGDSDWAELREAQSLALELPNTGQAVIIDLGEARDIHPRNKHEVGRRLALIARRVAYGQEVVDGGPILREWEVRSDGSVRLAFDRVAGGLLELGGGALRGFTVAGEDQVFHHARASIQGRDTVILECPEEPAPVAVRYGWADNPGCNLGNQEGLPASPFRTDRWPGVTDGRVR